MVQSFEALQTPTKHEHHELKWHLEYVEGILVRIKRKQGDDNKIEVFNILYKGKWNPEKRIL